MAVSKPGSIAKFKPLYYVERNELYFFVIYLTLNLAYKISP